MITRTPWFVWALAAGQFVLHTATNGRYGMFRDEFYYLACADRLAWGYVDHPPLSIAILKASRALLGDSVGAVRVLPALLGAFLMIGTARLAREMGGGRFAQALASLAIGFAPVVLVLTGYASMNAWDLAFWLAMALIVARIVRSQEPRAWLLGGGILGLGLLNKYSLAFFALGLAVALPFTSLRSHLRSRWFGSGLLLTVLLVLPHLIWQIRNDWPTAEFIANAKHYKIAALSPGAFLFEQLMMFSPLGGLIWVPGLVGLLVWPRLAPYRMFAVAFFVVLALLLVQHGKPYYLAPAYPPLLAGGAIVWGELAAGRRAVWLRGLLLLLVGAGAGVTLPLAVPLLSPADLVAYQTRLGLSPANMETHVAPSLPQYFADRFGWEELAHTVARAYAAMPEADRERCLVVASNYGEAGALRYYGRGLGLPPALSQHNNFWYWTPPDWSGGIVLAVGYDAEKLEQAFHSVAVVARARSDWTMPYESDLPIHLCRGWRKPPEEIWAEGRLYI